MPTLKDYLDLNYTVLVREVADGSFFAEIAEFPGCWAEGESEEEARAILKEAKELWIKTQLADGQPIPEPVQKRPPVVLEAPAQLMDYATSAIVNESIEKIFSDSMWTLDLATRTSDFVAIPGQALTTQTSTPTPSLV